MSLRRIVPAAILLASLVAIPAGTQTAASATTAPAASTSATPALWSVQGKHRTVYLFGTLHVLPAGMQWQTPAFKGAFNSSSVLYEETDDTRGDKLLPQMIKLGMDENGQLSKKISAADYAAVKKVCKQVLDMPDDDEDVLESMRPWLADLLFLAGNAVEAARPGDNSPEKGNLGVDDTLAAEAKQQGKPVKALETQGSVMHLFADAPESAQIEHLHQDVAGAATGGDGYKDLVGKWSSGKGAEDVDADQDTHSADWQTFVVKRNLHFADGIVALLDSADTKPAFVAVGAGHYEGPDGLPALLRKRGYKITRVQ